MKCPNCGKEINDSVSFCGFCGERVLQMSSEETTPVVQNVQESPQAPVEIKVPEPEIPAPMEAGLPEKILPEEEQKDPGVPVKDTPRREKKNRKTQGKKKHTGRYVLIVFVLLAFIGGGALGFLEAVGGFSLKELFSGEHIKWNKPTEGYTQSTVPDGDPNDPGDK